MCGTVSFTLHGQKMTHEQAWMTKQWPKCKVAGLTEFSPFYFSATAAQFPLTI
jgi:hypothetical protein